MTGWRLVRDIGPDSPAVRISGWARWRVVDGAGQLVGLVVEERDWLGDTYGEATYTAAHNPVVGDFEATYRTEGHPTPQAALAALVAHLEGGADD